MCSLNGDGKLTVRKFHKAPLFAPSFLVAAKLEITICERRGRTGRETHCVFEASLHLKYFKLSAVLLESGPVPTCAEKFVFYSLKY